MTDWWRKATGKANVTSTRLRKMHALQLHKVDPTSKMSAHRLMCHSSRTAEKHYMIHNLSDMAAHGHTVLTANIKLKGSMRTETTEIQSPNKRLLSQKQLDDIDLLFSQIIRTNAPLTLNETRNIISDSLNFVEHVEDDNMVHKVYKRVKYLQGKPNPQALQSLEVQDSVTKTSTWVASTSFSASSSSKRMPWAKEDEETIVKAFKDFQKCPSKATITEIFKSDPDRQELEARNTMSRCYEKVKNLFKRKTT